MATIVSPCARSNTIPRCTTERDWWVTDMAVRGNKLAVSGYNYRTLTSSFIDLFTLNDPDSSSPLMTQLCTKAFDHSGWPSYRRVSFLDDSRIVTVYGDLVQVYHIEADDSEPLHTVKLLHYGSARCMTVREEEILISLTSKEVIVSDFSLDEIKTITLEGLEGYDYPVDITFYGDNLFISTEHWRAIRYNMEGKIVHEYKTPGYSCACSITVSGLVYILWDCLHVVVYYLSDSQQLISFDVDRSHRIRIVDVNRLLAVDSGTGEVREYSMDLLKKRYLQKVFAEMTRGDSENLANFFMFPLKHVKAIINSPSHSEDLLVELENKGNIQSALTDELFENLGVLNIKLLTGRSEGSKSSIKRPSSTFLKHEEGEGRKPSTYRSASIFLKQEEGEGRKSSIYRSSSIFHKQQLTAEEEGKRSYSSIDSPSSAHFKQQLTMEEEGEGSKSSTYRPSPTFLKHEEGEGSKSSIRRPSSTLFRQREGTGIYLSHNPFSPFHMRERPMQTLEEGKGSYSSFDSPSSVYLKQNTTVEEEGTRYQTMKPSGTRAYRSAFQRRSGKLTVKEEEDWKPPDTMKITSSISEKGGLLQIPNTGIKLVFPPNAVTEGCNIQVKIIPPSLLNESTTSFSSNSSVVLELLPNGLQLKREVSLTLPHCLTFINEEKAKAKVYVSHHEEGQRPCWEERPLSPYIFHRSKCTVRLLDFCWLKIVIDDTEVEAKDIVVYAANKILNDKETARVSIGYYEDLPGREPKILKLNPDLKLVQSLPCTIFKEGNQPLTISFNGTNPHNTWCTEQGNARQEIPWGYLYLSKEFLVHFELQRRQSRDSLCKFTAQQGNSDPIKFSIEMENLSRGEIADSTVPYYILEYVATELAEEWQRLARGLDISDADLHNIKTNNSGHMQDTKYFMLHKWRKRNGAGATCTVLAEALDKAGRKDLQQYVKRQVTMQGRNVPTQDS